MRAGGGRWGLVVDEDDFAFGDALGTARGAEGGQELGEEGALGAAGLGLEDVDQRQLEFFRGNPVVEADEVPGRGEFDEVEPGQGPQGGS